MAGQGSTPSMTDEGKDRLLEEHRQAFTCKYPYEVIYGGHRFKCKEGVFGRETDFALPEMISSIPVGNRMLEIGTGTGGFVAALYLNRHGAIDSILATDINPRAIENAKENFAKYDIPAEVRVSDVFGSISEEEKFDAIFWNPPFFYCEGEVSMMERSFADTKYLSIEAYIRDAAKYLKKGGRVSFLFNHEAGNWELIQGMCRKFQKELKLLYEIKDYSTWGLKQPLQIWEIVGAE